MSWFKKIFGSQYGFSSQSSAQDSSQSSLQEPKVHYTKQKNEIDDNEKEIKNLTISKTEKCSVTFILEESDYRKKILYLS